MKVAICSVQEFNPMIGGIERVSVSLANELISRGVEVIFICCRKSPYGGEYHLPAHQYVLPDSTDYSEANVSKMAEIIREEHVDVILNQNAHSYLYNRQVFLVREKCSVPVVSVLHFDPLNRIKANQHLVDFQLHSIKNNIIGFFRQIAVSPLLTPLSMHSQRRLFRQIYLSLIHI